MNLTNRSNYSVVSGSSDADTIYNYGSHVTIQGDSGNDYLVSFGKLIVGDSYAGDVVVYGGYGSDSIAAYGASMVAYGGAGNDSIYTSGDDSTIVGGTGNDTIYVAGVPSRLHINYTVGDGNDLIRNFDYNTTSSSSTININGTSNYGRYDSGTDAIITVGSTGSITVEGMAGKTINIVRSDNVPTSPSSGQYISDNSSNPFYNTVVSGTSGNDTIYTRGDYVTVNGGDGDDKITSFDRYNDSSYVGNLTLNGGAGSDTIYSWGYPAYIDGGTGADYLYAGDNNITVSGGDGDDSIITYGKYTSIYAGSGDDTINVTSLGDYSTVQGGWGNDRISISSGATGVVIQQSYLDDYDTIEGFNSDDTIKITAGSSYTKSDVGNDLLIAINTTSTDGSIWDSSILLLGMAGQNVNIIGTAGDVIETVAPETVSTEENTQMTLEDLIQSLSNTGGVTINVYPNATVVGGDVNNITNIVNNSTSNTNISYTVNNDNSITLIDNSVHNYLTVTNNTNTYNYRGGDQFISNYNSTEIVDISQYNYTGIDLHENTFYVGTDGGSVGIENVRDKVVTYNRNGQQFARYSYIASQGGFIDGSWMTERSMLIGADGASNQIAAGSGGSSLWGGSGGYGSDLLMGGAGYDEFFYAYGDGNDTISNFGANDLVNIGTISGTQISGVYFENKTFVMQFTNGQNLRVESETQSNYWVDGHIMVADHNSGLVY